MSSISSKINFYACDEQNLGKALALRDFCAVLTDRDTDFKQYSIISSFEDTEKKHVPIVQILKPIDTTKMCKKHVLTVQNDPNTKRRIKAYKAGAAYAITAPVNANVLHAILLRLATRQAQLRNVYKQEAKQRSEATQLEYEQCNKGFKLSNTGLYTNDYEPCLRSEYKPHFSMRLSYKERIILKAMAEANCKPMLKQDLHTYLRDRHCEHSDGSLPMFINTLNKKLAAHNVHYMIARGTQELTYQFVRSRLSGTNSAQE